ncbi:MAG: sigma-70 family RNA polymerase sigma factor [Firmicutes bacterium]|nr:sigma-70 family RNA polymerase sigma factor [Bacillota bacterium]
MLLKNKGSNMSINSKNISKLSPQELYNELLVIITKVRQKYDYVNLSDSEFQKVIISKLKQICSKNEFSNDQDLETYFTKAIEKEYFNLIKQIMHNLKTAELIINSFIENKIGSAKSYKSALRELDKLKDFFVFWGYYPSPDLCLKLISNHERLKNILKLVVDSNIKKIQSETIDEVFENEIIFSFVNCYCILNNINIDPKVDSDEKIYESLEDQSEFSGNVDITRQYFQEINKPLLTLEEERELAYRVMQGDMQAKELLVERNLRLVVTIAKKHLGRGLSLLDLIQEGNVGLITAVERYDVTKGFRFATYAVNWIRQGITRAIADKGRNVRLSVDKQTKINQFRKAKTQLEKELNREPLLEEIAEYLGISEVKAKELHDLQFDTVSLNTVVGDDNNTELEHFVASSEQSPEEEVIDNSLEEQVKVLLRRVNLKPREIEVLIHRFGLYGNEAKTLEEVGQMLNLTRERIRQIENKAIQKIRKSPYIKSLAIYMSYPEEAEHNIDLYRKNPKYKPVERETKPKKVVIKEEEQMAKQIRSLYEYFDTYSKEAINEMVAKLSEADRALLTKRYGADLENPDYSSKLTKQETTTFYGSLIPKMRRLLENPNLERRPRKSRTPKVNNSVDSSENILKPVQEEPSDPIEPECESGQLICNQQNYNEDRVTKEACIKILEMLKTPSFGQMMGTLSAKEAVIISLKLGYIDGKYFSTSAIANFLGIEDHEVIETTRKVLLLYKESFDKFLDEAIKYAMLDFDDGTPKR